MADVIPNYSLEVQGLELERAQLKLNAQSQLYRIAQMQDEERRIEGNIEATKAAIDLLTDKINSLTKA